VLLEAEKAGGEIIIRGENILTGKCETKYVNRNTYTQKVISYEDLGEN
jgi:hypothetical protein